VKIGLAILEILRAKKKNEKCVLTDVALRFDNCVLHELMEMEMEIDWRNNVELSRVLD